MAETGFVRFPGSLDPRAEEFRPRNPNNPTHLVLFHPPPQPPPPPPVYYQFSSPFTPISEVQLLPYSEVGIGYPQFSSPPAYVSQPPVPVRLPVPPTQSSVATRAILLSSVPGESTESTIWNELEAFGEVRGVQMERLCDGIVTVHFYDLRHAEMALKEVREQHMNHQTRLRNHYSAALFVQNSSPGEQNLVPSLQFPIIPPARGLVLGRPVWAQFVIPASNSVPEGNNQGTIVIFNLDPDVTAFTLKEIFQAFGSIKELRETPSKKHQRFVEFFDVRDAAKALKEMNGKEINGKSVVIEFSRPGGYSRKFAAINTTKSFYPRAQNYPPPPPPPPPEIPRKFSSHSTFNVVPHRSYTQFPSRKSSFAKPVERKLASFNLGDSISDGVEERDFSHGVSKKLTRKSQYTQLTESSKAESPLAKQQQEAPPPGRNRSRKLKHTKKFDSRFLISEDAMMESNCRDTRTTVMIKNIPNKYSQKLLFNMLDNHCIHCNEQIANNGDDQPFSAYDFVYLPIDFNNKCNVGYGFVNMTSPQATWRLYKAFHLQHWEVFNSRKICEVTYARVQGLEALKEHFKNSKFPCEMDHYLPVVFSPPRDGKQLTEPLPIVGQTKLQPILPSKEANDEMDGEDDGFEKVNETSDGSDDAEQSHHKYHLLLMGDNSTGWSSCSSRSLNGGVVGDDDDDFDDDDQC
ncbi:hypothetical protein UlMin_040129 [Ulmus minor]